jgi:hypothetical protein
MPLQPFLTVDAFNAELADGHYAHGGYPKYFIMADGGALSFKAAVAEQERIREAIAETVADDGWFNANAPWLPIACDVNWEDAELTCDHTGARIESAYAENDA